MSQELCACYAVTATAYAREVGAARTAFQSGIGISGANTTESTITKTKNRTAAILNRGGTPSAGSGA
jgi:hypothetical protein